MCPISSRTVQQAPPMNWVSAVFPQDNPALGDFESYITVSKPQLPGDRAQARGGMGSLLGM